MHLQSCLNETRLGLVFCFFNQSTWRKDLASSAWRFFPLIILALNHLSFQRITYCLYRIRLGNPVCSHMFHSPSGTFLCYQRYICTSPCTPFRRFLKCQSVSRPVKEWRALSLKLSTSARANYLVFRSCFVLKVKTRATSSAAS